MHNIVEVLKRLGRHSPVLHTAWGKLRWYSSRPGLTQIGLKFRHFGWTVECPFCGWKGNSFYPHPVPHPRPNAICPRCESKERHRLLFLYLNRKTNIFAEPTDILEIAPGPYSYYLFGQQPLIKYFTIDYESAHAQCHADITQLPLPTQSVDLIICYHVLEHVMDDRRALTEIHRVLRNTGMLLIQVPIEAEITWEDPTVTDPNERLRLFGQEDHVRVYGKDFTDRLEQMNFEVHIDDFAAHLPKNIIHRYGLDSNELIFVCRVAGRL